MSSFQSKELWTTDHKGGDVSVHVQLNATVKGVKPENEISALLARESVVLVFRAFN